MPLKRQCHTVALYTPTGIVEHVVEVGPGDQLRAELEGAKRGLLPKGVAGNPLVFASLGVYFAAVKAGLTTATFDVFIHQECYDFDPLKDDDQDDGGEDVDPTSSEDPSASGSSSLSGSPEQPTGSTPTSTND